MGGGVGGGGAAHNEGVQALAFNLGTVMSSESLLLPRVSVLYSHGFNELLVVGN